MEQSQADIKTALEEVRQVAKAHEDLSAKVADLQQDQETQKNELKTELQYAMIYYAYQQITSISLHVVAKVSQAGGMVLSS